MIYIINNSKYAIKKSISFKTYICSNLISVFQKLCLHRVTNILYIKSNFYLSNRFASISESWHALQNNFVNNPNMSYSK